MIIQAIQKKFGWKGRILPAREIGELELLADGPFLFGSEEGKEKFERYKQKNGPNYIWLSDMKGIPPLREGRLREIAKQFGATRAWQGCYSIPDIEASYNIWDEGNNMTTSVRYNDKIIVFTFKALEDIIGKCDNKVRRDKEVTLPPEIKKQCKDGFGGYDFTMDDKNPIRSIERLLHKAVNIADQIGANIIHVYKMDNEPLLTTMTLQFYRF